MLSDSTSGCLPVVLAADPSLEFRKVVLRQQIVLQVVIHSLRRCLLHKLRSEFLLTVAGRLLLLEPVEDSSNEQTLRIRKSARANRSIGANILMYTSHLVVPIIQVGHFLWASAKRLRCLGSAWVGVPSHPSPQFPGPYLLAESAIIEHFSHFPFIYAYNRNFGLCHDKRLSNSRTGQEVS